MTTRLRLCPESIARVEPRVPGQMFPGLAFVVAYFGGHLNSRHNIQIPVRSSAFGQTSSPNPQFLAPVRSGGNLDVDPPVEGWHRDIGAQDRFPGCQVGYVNQIVPVDFKIRMLGEAHAQEQISGGAAANAGLPPTGYPQTLAFA